MRPIRIAAQLHPQHGAVARPARRRPARRGARLRHRLHLGPLLPALRRPRRRPPRVLDDARRLGRGDQPDRDRRARHLQLVPQPGPARGHGPDRRPRRRRPADPRPRARAGSGATTTTYGYEFGTAGGRLAATSARRCRGSRPASRPQPAARAPAAGAHRRPWPAADDAARRRSMRTPGTRVPGPARGAGAGRRRAARLVRRDRARPGVDRVGRGHRARRPRPVPRRRRRDVPRDGLHPVHARVQRAGVGRGRGRRVPRLARRAQRRAARAGRAARTAGPRRARIAAGTGIERPRRRRRGRARCGDEREARAP